MEPTHRGEDAATVLVVEDDADIRRLLVHLLSNAGLRCISAADAEQALALAHTVEFDLLVTDIHLPGMSGAELGWRLRQERPALPLVAVTAHLGAWDRDDLADLGFSATVRKPLNGAAFVGVCLELLRRPRWPGAKGMTSGLTGDSQDAHTAHILSGYPHYSRALRPWPEIARE